MDGAAFMKVLITGGSGFIGRNLQRSLCNYDLTMLTRQSCDLTNASEVNKFFENKFFDIVIHAAVVGGNRLIQDNFSVLDKNLMMYYNLLSNKSCFKKFIYFGSGAASYYSSTPYGLSKHVISQSISDKPNFYNINIFAVFGEDELDRRFIKTNIKKYLQKEPMEIFQNKYMDFFYISDLITLVQYYLDNENPPKEIDCKYSESVTLLDIANIINNLSSHKVDIVIQKDGLAEAYIGNYKPLPIALVGLKAGIQEIFHNFS